MVLDVIPFTPREIEEMNRMNEQYEKEAAKIQKKAEKLKKKAEKKLKKEQKKIEKQQKKAEKMLKKEQKKLEKQGLQVVKDLSETNVSTTATVQDPTNAPVQPTEAAMPAGIILMVCAAFLFCIGSAWFYRRRQSDSAAS